MAVGSDVSLDVCLCVFPVCPVQNLCVHIQTYVYKNIFVHMCIKCLHLYHQKQQWIFDRIDGGVGTSGSQSSHVAVVAKY